ncbi:response regulator [Thiomicrorhabdus indica]|uniref:response regulator n=1 Tax=Thiomicrorhabdus indica TaxID=2267253 RepID=UPI002AA71D1C|nr:response regulator [Thiomicrorhabdus indica]
MQVLLVDDDLFMRKIQSSILSRSGYHVILAESGEEALQKLAMQAVDFVLMDIRMPQMDGLETTRKFRQMNQQTPVIALSGDCDNELIQAARTAGMNGFLTKPLKPENLQRELLRFFV